MRIVDKRAPMNKYEFKDLEVGAVFFVGQDLFMKLPHAVDDDDVEVNAINLSTYQYEELSYCEWCLPVQAELTIDFYR